MNVEEPQDRLPYPNDDRPGLAKLRTELALDRTMLAWVRTTLSMVGFGFGMIAFFRTLQLTHPGDATSQLHVLAIGFGLALLLLGLVAMFLAGLAHRADLKRLRRDKPPALRKWSLALAVTGFMILLGVAGLVALWML